MPSRLVVYIAAFLLFAAHASCAHPTSDAVSLIAPRASNITVQLATTFDPLNVPKDCQPICLYLSGMFGKNPPCSENACICTNGFINEYGLCADCVFRINGHASDPNLSQAQATLNQTISDCNKTGFTVNSYTLQKSGATQLTGHGFVMGLTAVALGLALALN